MEKLLLQQNAHCLVSGMLKGLAVWGVHALTSPPQSTSHLAENGVSSFSVAEQPYTSESSTH